MTLQERHTALLQRAMALSRQHQEASAQLAQLEQEMLKAAGAIEVLEALIAAAESHHHGK